MKTELDLPLEGVVGLVGGGARDGGISQSILEQLLMAGTRVAFIANDARGKAVEQRLRDRGADVLFVQGDLRRFSDAQRFVEIAERKFGPAKVVVNAVGGHPEKSSTSAPPESRAEQIMAYVTLNVVSHVHLIEAALPMLLDQEGDKSVVSIGTINPKLPWLAEPDYAGAKNQLESQILDYAALYAKDGIRFNLIHPGSVPGPNSKTWPDRLKDPRVRNHLRRLIPLGRLGRADDISIWVLLFASPLTCWTTG
jgi:NAD(P)-dependent dehydrogenase (short-subunit alcohol dehydrogenase family)